MKVTLFMSMSLNGVIARNNDEEDFITINSWNTFLEYSRKADCVIRGRKSQELINGWEQEYKDQIKGITTIIVGKEISPSDDYFICSTIDDALKLAREKQFDNILLVGGSQLNTSFAKDSLINEVIVLIQPSVIGQGYHLFKEDDFDLKLELISSSTLENGVIELKYKVIN